jgi:ribosomal protein S18 acetylase RimI-like enzyme
MEWFRSLLQKMLADTLDDLKSDSDYIQMKLPIEKITNQFEDALNIRAEQGIIQTKIREANLNDIKTFQRLHKLIWENTQMRYKPFSEDLLRDLIKDPNITFLIAEVDGIDSGFGIVYFTGNKKDVGVVAALGVLPTLQGKGLGTILGLKIWEFFKSKGLKELHCRVSKENKNGYRFIRSLGFEDY